MVRVALYARVSRPDKNQNGEKKQTNENQLLKLRAFATARAYAIIGEYSDEASGASPHREGLERMLKDAYAHRFDAILIVRLDRLARSTRHLLNLLSDLQGYGVDLVCSDQEIDTKSPAGKLLFTVLGAVAELERELISERTKDGLARARAHGKRLGRPPKPELAEQIAELRAQGLSLRQIGEKVGLSHQAVKQRLRRARVQNRVGKAG